MASPSYGSYISNLQNIRDSARETLTFIKQNYPHIQKQKAAHCSTSPIPALQLPFPDELTDILRSMTVSQDTRRLLSERLRNWHHSIQNLQTNKFRQACHDLSWLSRDGLPLAVENLRLTYERLYMQQIVPRVRSDLLSMKARVSQNGTTSLGCTKNPFNTTFVPLLEDFFSENPYPNAQERRHLAHKSEMTTRQIEVWFQNHRRRAKQDGRSISRKCFRSLSIKRTPSISSINDETYSSTDESCCEKPESLSSLHSFHDFRPQHAFPTIYPAVGILDPFPCEKGVFKFPPLAWDRKPATVAASHQMVDVDDLCQLFASKLNLRGSFNGRKPRRSVSQVWFASTTTIIPRAPHPSLLRSNPSPRLAASNLPSVSSLPPVVFGSISRPGRPKKSPNVQGRWPHAAANNSPTFTRSTTLYEIPSPLQYSRSRLSSSSSISSVGPETPPPLSPYVHSIEVDFPLLDQLFDVPSRWEKDILLPAPVGLVA